MIPVLIGLAIGGVLLVANWDSVVDWLSDFIPKLRKKWAELREFVPHEAQIVGDRIDNLVRIMHKLFYKEKGQWFEETTTRKVPANEVPSRIRNKINRQETDITTLMEAELGLEV